MLSIIICSISPEKLQCATESIKNTIGTDYEIIAIDNREKNWSISKVYNEGARQARYPYLFFVHEDVIFHRPDWGTYIEKKLSEPDCGVIGFAGSKMLPDCYTGWGQYHWKWHSSFYFYVEKGENNPHLESWNIHLEKPYEPVAVVDGFAFFVRKEVWEEFPFDEEMITGFHGYDLDFSLQIGRKYKNYVCGLYVWIEHLSQGNFSTAWVKDTIRLYEQKWHAMLPVYSSDLQFTQEEYDENKEFTFYRFLFKALRADIPKKDKGRLLKIFWKFPFTWSHWRHCLSCTFKYLRCK